MNSNNKKYISDIVTQEQIKQWSDNEIVIISAPTGKGKSHFIKNTLYDYAHQHDYKILMLVHRTNCVDQFKIELSDPNKLDRIEIITYQKLEYMIRQGHELNLNHYDYFVLDEFHYNISDSAFNRYTDLSIDLALSLNKGVRIFMSATGDDMKRYIKGYKKIDTIDYDIPEDYSHIQSLMFYNKDDSLYELAKQAIEENRKTIFFIQSAEKAYKLYNKFKDYSMFVCSQSNKKYSKYIDKSKLLNMLTNERFDDLILITTTCLDSGVNIKDTELNHIIIDVKDTNSLIQCLGRKRILNNNDTINVLIKSISNQALGGMITQLNKKRSMAKYLRDNGLYDYLNKYKRDAERYGLIYDEYVGEGKAEKKINYLMYFKCLMDSTEFDTIIKWYGKFAYNKYIARKLHFYDEVTNTYMYDMLNESNSNELESYLNEIIGKVLLERKDRKELIERINVKQDGKLLKSINSLNAALEERNINYYIKQFETSRIINGKKKNYKSAWKILKLVEK